MAPGVPVHERSAITGGSRGPAHRPRRSQRSGATASWSCPGWSMRPASSRIRGWTDDVQGWPETPGKWMKYFEQDAAGQRLLNRLEDVLPFHAGFRELAASEALAGACGQLFGEPAVLFKDKINFKQPGGGGFEPHQDVQAGWSRYASLHITALLTIDRSTRANGCLEMAANFHGQRLIGAEWEPLTAEAARGHRLGGHRGRARRRRVLRFLRSPPVRTQSHGRASGGSSTTPTTGPRKGTTSASTTPTSARAIRPTWSGRRARSTATAYERSRQTVSRQEDHPLPATAEQQRAGVPARGPQRHHREDRRGGRLPRHLGRRPLHVRPVRRPGLQRGQLDPGAGDARVHGRCHQHPHPARRRHRLRQLQQRPPARAQAGAAGRRRRLHRGQALPQDQQLHRRRQAAAGRRGRVLQPHQGRQGRPVGRRFRHHHPGRGVHRRLGPRRGAAPGRGLPRRRARTAS